MKKFMVVETSKPGCLQAAYDRLYQKGRMLPEGLIYVDSWLERGGPRCFQLMETADPKLFDEWIAHWSDLTDFEVIEIGEKPKDSEHDAD